MAELRTAFWRKAAKSLHASCRERYIGHLAQAERFELALDALVELISRKKNHFHPRVHSA